MHLPYSKNVESLDASLHQAIDLSEVMFDYDLCFSCILDRWVTYSALNFDNHLLAF